ncbi:MAG: hypothetical protein B2I17_02980 [Thermoplasmatales archaeon B_DKE]|nr:MAG: hypothetical protein B2I17_02980 [Thermoplasmatales archaeon B_DKE]QRF75686.1 SNARE associated Golgi protein [Thermoplasmatales archaeon]
MLDLSLAILFSLGYLGIFALSLGSNLIVYIPVPYLFLILAVTLSGQFDPALLVVSSASGAAAGKMIVFQSFYTGSRIVKPETRKNLTAFRTIFSRYAWMAVFLAAATPIPDDIVYTPLGLARYNRVRFFIALLSGKIVITLMIVYGASFLLNSAFGTIFLGGDASSTIDLIVAGVIFAIIAIALSYMISRADWSKWIEKRASNRTKDKKDP